jgi:hypothetical protein
MGNTVANALTNGAAVYTATPGLNLSWLWSSPLYKAWRYVRAAVSFFWLAVRTVLATMLAVLQIGVTVMTSYRFITVWLLALAVSFAFWMEFPFIMGFVRDYWRNVNNALFFYIFFINMGIQYYNMIVLIWNPFYPLLGFFLYVAFDVIFGFFIEFIKILGEPAIAQLAYLFVNFLTVWVQLWIAVLTPMLRYMPSVGVMLSAQAGPIVEVIASVAPVLFPMVSWTFGKLFYALFPILSLVVWAVNKVRKLLGRRNTARQVFMGATFAARQLLQIFAPAATSGAALPALNATTSATISQDLQALLGDVDVRMASLLEQQQQQQHARSFETPQHAAPDYGPNIGQNLDADGQLDEDVWQEVGATGMRMHWDNPLAADAARAELEHITGYLMEHPQESYEELAMRSQVFIETLGTPQSAATYDEAVESQAFAKRSLFAYKELDSVASWFSATEEKQDDPETLRRLQRSVAQEHAAAQQHKNEQHAPAYSHHAYIHKMMALGTPPHMLRNARLDPGEINARYTQLVNRTRWSHPHRVRAAIERDIAAGDVPATECTTSVHCNDNNNNKLHPSTRMRERHARFADVRTRQSRAHDEGGEWTMEDAKQHLLTVDAAQHASNAALHRLANGHLSSFDALHEQVSHHGSVLLATVTGHESLIALIDHVSTNYSSFHHLQHELHARALAPSALYQQAKQLDPHYATRPFYDDYMRHQVFHTVLEHDETHGHLRPVVYVELVNVDVSKRLRRSMALQRTLLYTLPIFDFLSKLDCYTTTPRAPLCLPDFFPDNWQLSGAWLPLEFPFPDDVNPRCFCAQFFCEQPRLWGKVFPNGPWPNLDYFVGWCRYRNAFVVLVILLALIRPVFFLSLAALISRVGQLRPLLEWMFVLPAGEMPSVRILLCAFSHTYSMVLLAFTIWLGGGIIVSRLWPIVEMFTTRISVWLATQRQRDQDLAARKTATLEADVFNYAYDSKLNTDARDYNAPGDHYKNSLGVRQYGYNNDPLFDTRQQMSEADRLRFTGTGGGQLPHLLPPYDTQRTRYEAVAETPELRRDAYGYYVRPGSDEYDDATRQISGLIAARDHHSYVIGSNHASADEALEAAAAAAAAAAREQQEQQVACSYEEMQRRQQEDLLDLQSIDTLQRELSRNLAYFGQPWVRVHTHTYNTWHRWMRWLLDTHHFTEHWQQQMTNARRRVDYEREHLMPVRGPLVPARR